MRPRIRRPAAEPGYAAGPQRAVTSSWTVRAPNGRSQLRQRYPRRRGSCSWRLLHPGPLLDHPTRRPRSSSTSTEPAAALLPGVTPCCACRHGRESSLVVETVGDFTTERPWARLPARCRRTRHCLPERRALGSDAGAACERTCRGRTPPYASLWTARSRGMRRSRETSSDQRRAPGEELRTDARRRASHQRRRTRWRSRSGWESRSAVGWPVASPKIAIGLQVIGLTSR